ncbi:alpha/beta hydrolase [Sphingomonas sp. TREG-RG-20F-R18-01]|uniref:alpha/beta hydrolase family protein n=1 Tax=Sphingomonas sp. TREG-RG-20F-R18-01 TaxID=2914982 RepID=UPI001F5987B4|nr:alpha/beta hydrolase [Sphingomonas sp. TREG-RG-20F-R18-01]
MRRYYGVIAIAMLVGLGGAARASDCAPRRQLAQLPLPGFSSAAEVEMPPAGVAARGVLILFAGSDVADMDGAIAGVGGTIVSRPMLQVADRLACAGFVSFRYNKRYVSGPTTVDRAKFDQLNGVDLAADGRAAIAFVRGRSDLRDLPLGLVGWSEGTTVAMAVAAGDRSVRGLVLMAPVVESPARVAQAQYLRIGKPYLERFAVDGALDGDAIARADAGPGGDLAHVFVRMFKGFRPGERVNPLLDGNADGRVTFAEADPVIASWYVDSPNSGLGMSSTARALRGVADAFPATDAPILILQGMDDSMIDPGAAITFVHQPTVRQRVKLIAYPKLGHSLGEVASAQNDTLPPVAAQPLDDMAAWLGKTLRR